MSYQETIVLSLGGSLIVPKEGIDTNFLASFNKFVRREIATKNRRFFIICGGGQTTRLYQQAATTVVSKLPDEDKDWLGIHATRLNAHLIRTIFKDIAHPRIIDKYDRKTNVEGYPVVVCSGWRPGWSTDYCAVMVAKNWEAKTIINLSNIDKVYDKDPRQFSDARPIDKITWSNFQRLVGDKWTPGLNMPFDPIASKLARQLGLMTIILNGKNIQNLTNAIEGKKFTGTVITAFTVDTSFYDREYYAGDKHVKAPTLMHKLLPVRSLYRALFIKLRLNPQKVLDVGCGLGHTIGWLRRLGIEAYGLEISHYALKQALPHIKPYLKYGDIRSIPYPDRTFDLVTTFDVLEHVHEEDISQAVAECQRVSSKYILHKIYTQENSWLSYFYGSDLSLVSVYSKNWWEKLWQRLKYKIVSKHWFWLPDAFDTSFLLKK